MSVLIRACKLSDLDAVLEITNYAILKTTAIYDDDARTMAELTNWFLEKQEKNFPVVVAVQNEIVIGYGTYGAFRQKYGSRFTVEHSVYVNADNNGKGIGSMLLSELINQAKSQTMRTMIAAIDASNEASIAFHRKFGFREIGVCHEAGYKFNQWLDLLLMELMLES